MQSMHQSREKCYHENKLKQLCILNLKCSSFVPFGGYIYLYGHKSKEKTEIKPSLGGAIIFATDT